MKKIISILCVLFLVSNAKSQILTPINGYGQKHLRLQIDSFLKPPADTIYNAPVGSLAIKNGVVYQRKASRWDSLKTGPNIDTTKYFRHNGNSLGAIAVLGTNDSYDLKFETNNTTHLQLGSDGTFYSPSFNWSFNTDNSFQLGTNAGFSLNGDVKIPNKRFINFAQNDAQTGINGFGFWDSLGIIKFKDSTGAWKAISSLGGLDTSKLPKIFASTQHINGNHFDLYLDSIDNIIASNSENINLYGSNSAALRSGGNTLLEGVDVDITGNLDIVSNSGVGFWNPNTSVFNRILNQGNLWTIDFADNTKSLTLDGTNLGGNTMTLPASDGTPIYRINGNTCDVAGDFVLDSNVITDVHSEAYYNTKYAPVSVNGTVTSISRTNGLGIIASITNPTTTPNITIGVDTGNASILSQQRAAATYQGILNGTGAVYSTAGTITYKKFIDSTEKTYSSTITFTGGTAPSGTTNHTYEWSQNGRLVTFRLNMHFGTAGSGNTAVSFAIPSDMPTPSLITGYQFSIDDRMIVFPCNGGNTKTISNPLSAGLVYNAGTPLLKAFFGSQNMQYLQITGSYFTNN